MKKINFINAIEPQEQQALNRWMHISTISAITLCCSISILQLEQLWRLHNIHGDVRAANIVVHTAHAQETTLLTKNDFKNEKQRLQEQTAKLVGRLRHTKNPCDYLTEISTALESRGALSSINANKDGIEMVIKTTHLEGATDFLDAIKKSQHLKNLKIVSLQPAAGNGSQMICTIKGILTH